MRRESSHPNPATLEASHSYILLLSLRKYRAIKVVSWQVYFSTDAIADFEGLLAVNREICKQQMSEKAPPDVPPYCAVVP
ncbi:MAG: hypothetical protein J6S60_05325 [Oscillospiraceae bacterium]|nr:hypothetical protein [Oscillospiraceae bacterium]